MKHIHTVRASVLYSHHYPNPDPAFIKKAKQLGEELAIHHARLLLAYPIGFALWVHLGYTQLAETETLLLTPARNMNEYQFAYHFPLRADFEYFFSGTDPENTKRLTVLNSDICFFDMASPSTESELQLCIESGVIIAILEHDDSKKFYTDYFKQHNDVYYVIDFDPKRLVEKAIHLASLHIKKVL